MLTPKILVIVFHSYPSKPCIDGLMATVLATRFETSDVKLVPYWRTEQSYQRLKRTVEKHDLENTTVLYLDCAPDLHQEVEYLLSVINKVSVMVYDHHPKKKDSPIDKLEENNVNFKCKIDETHCGAKMVFKYLLKEKEQEELKEYSDLLHLVHFSDYEGVDDARSGKTEAVNIADAAFEKAMAKDPSGKNTENLFKIINMGMALYFILDSIMAVPDDWKFLYGDDSDENIFEEFKKQEVLYLEHAVSTVSGVKDSVFCAENTSDYLHRMCDLEKKLEAGVILKAKQIGNKKADVFVCHVDIMYYGRSLEPYVQKLMRKREVHYAVLINNPAKNPAGQDTYYFSLRRDNSKCSDYDARDLATYIKTASGTKIGGGHPWASGASLNTDQYRQFFVQEEIPM